MKSFILSAGSGARLQPLTHRLPKVMVEVGGKPVLEHLILLCKQYGVNEVIINLHHLPEKITAYFGDGSKWGVSIAYSHEKKLMGSAGALKRAEHLLAGETFFVLNGDVLTNVDLRDMLAFHRRKGGSGTIFVHKTNHPYDSDLVEYEKDFLVRRFFRIKPSQTSAKEGNSVQHVSKTGTHIFEPRVLDFIPDGEEYSLEKQLIPDLLKKAEKLYAYYSDAYSKDMGTPERLEQVRRDYEAGKTKPG